jgi:transglutaminase-like putative cysteine protease
MFLNRKPDNRTFLAEIPEGRAGVMQTLKLMSKLVKMFKVQPVIRRKAIALTAHLPGKKFTAEVDAVFCFVRDKIRYIQDVEDVETIQSPDVTLYDEAGDCDDKSTLLSALLESIGHKTRFRAIGLAPGEYEHVYVETLIGNEWVPLDATENVPVGWQPPEEQIAESALWHNH